MEKKIEEARKYMRGRVLNYGCGSPDIFGKLTHFANYTAYDPYIEGTDEIDGTYDTIFCSLVLEHVEDPKKTIGHMLSLLNKGGRLICVVPNVDSFHRYIREDNYLTLEDEEAGHRRMFDVKSFVKLFKHIEDIIHIGFKPAYTELMNCLSEYWDEYHRFARDTHSPYCAEIMVVVNV